MGHLVYLLYLNRMVHIVNDPDDTSTRRLTTTWRWGIRLCHRLFTSTSSRPSAGRAGCRAAVPHAVLLAVAGCLLLKRRYYFSRRH